METMSFEFDVSAENARHAAAFATELGNVLKRKFPGTTVTQTRADGDESLDAGTIIGIVILIKEAIKLAKALEGWGGKATGAKVTLKKNGTTVLEFSDALDAIEFVKSLGEADKKELRK